MEKTDKMGSKKGRIHEIQSFGQETYERGEVKEKSFVQVHEPLEYARLYLEGNMQMWIDAEDSLELWWFYAK